MYSELNNSQLSALLIQKNKEFSKAMKSKRPYAELVELFADIKAVYKEIVNKKESFSYVQEFAA